MLQLRQIEREILAKGRVDGPELQSLRRQFYAGDRIERLEANFLVELFKRVEHRSPAFVRFFYQAIKDHILAHGRIDAEETAWLQQMLGADGTISDEERKLLHELMGEAEDTCREFKELFRQCMKLPTEQHTCG